MMNVDGSEVSAPAAEAPGFKLTQDRVQEDFAPEMDALAAQVLSGLLRVVEPIWDGLPVQVDGISLRSKHSFTPVPPIYETAKTFTGVEPAIVLISSLFSQLLARYALTFKGALVEVDGFRVRDVERWARYPLSALEAVGPISSYCNARCVFCYEQGNKLPFNARFLSLKEAEDRLAHYSVKRGTGLPIGNTFSLETLCNPFALDILTAVRRRAPHEMLKITTHGSNLTDDTIEQLSRLKPIILIVSLNTVTPEGRRTLMADHHPEVALSALPKLRQAGIPFLGSVVPWPTLSLDDLEATLRYFDSQKARMVRVSLPSFTRHFRPEDMFNTDEVWGGIVERVLKVRPELATPINMMPTAYWNSDNRPFIEGTYVGSPAEMAGLKVGDLILEVKGRPMAHRQEVKELLEEHCRSDGQVDLTLLRGDAVLRQTIRRDDSDDRDCYPYKPRGYRTPNDAFGIFFSDGFKSSYVRDICSTLERTRARSAVVFTSQLIQPLFEKMSEGDPDFRLLAERSNLAMQTATCDYWGGNVMLGDLNVVQDFDRAIDAMLDQATVAPDLILLPATFLNYRGFDLRGAHYKELGKHRIPLEIIRCDVMMK